MTAATTDGVLLTVERLKEDKKGGLLKDITWSCDGLGGPFANFSEGTYPFCYF